jgi:hypothetical protein
MSSNLWKRIESKATRGVGRGDWVCGRIMEDVLELGRIHPSGIVQDILAKAAQLHADVLAEHKDRMSCSMSLLAAKPASAMPRALAAADDAVAKKLRGAVEKASKSESGINNLGQAFPKA